MIGAILAQKVWLDRLASLSLRHSSSIFYENMTSKFTSHHLTTNTLKSNVNWVLKFSMWGAHCFFTIMNHERRITFWFYIPVLLGIHRNPNWKEFLKFCKSFLRKSQLSTLTNLNPGFGGPWDILGIFIMLQKKSFGQKNFWISWTGSKVLFWQSLNLKML